MKQTAAKLSGVATYQRGTGLAEASQRELKCTPLPLPFADHCYEK